MLMPRWRCGERSWADDAAAAGVAGSKAIRVVAGCAESGGAMLAWWFCSVLVCAAGVVAGVLE